MNYVPQHGGAQGRAMCQLLPLLRLPLPGTLINGVWHEGDDDNHEKFCWRNDVKVMSSSGVHILTPSLAPDPRRRSHAELKASREREAE